MSRIILLLLVFFSQVVHAQVATGLYSLGPFDSKGFDTVNLANLNTHFSVPIYAKVGRGGMDFHYNLSYDSAMWMPVTSGASTTWQPAINWGWTVDTNAVTGYFTNSSASKKCFDSPPGWYWSTVQSNFNYVDNTGASHAFAGTVSDCSTFGPENLEATATDGSGYRLNAGINAYIIQDATGRTIQPPINTTSGIGQATDRNGNTITTSSGAIVDTTGSTVIALSGAGSPSSPKSLTFPVWESPTSSVTSASATINYQSYNIKTNFGCSGIGEASISSVSLVSSIVLADGEEYQFSYEPTPSNPGYVTARLHSVTLPTGGVISYGYSGGSNGIECGDGGTATLARTETSRSGSPTWTYSRTPGATTASTHTDVTDAETTPNHATYDFIGQTIDGAAYYYYTTNRQQYQGAATGTPLLSEQTYLTCYPGPCSGGTLTLPISVKSVITTLDGVSTKETVATYSSYGLLLSELDYDYGSSSPGSILHSTSISYASLSGAIVGMPGTVCVSKPGSINLGCTTYNYDETTPIPTSGLPHHVSVGASRGNLTSVVTNNSGPQGSLTSHATYDDSGQLVTSSDIKGNTSSYTYDPATNTYATSVSYPTTSGIAHTVSSTWDIASAAKKTDVDQNNTTTSYTYDVMQRLATTALPDGGLNTQTYSLTPSTPSIATSVKQSSSSTITQTAYLDPYGRLKQNDRTDTPHDDLTDYSYDGNGNIYSVSNPYRTGQTPVYTSYGYDGLDRMLLTTYPDSSRGLTYLGNTVTYSDEALHKRLIVADGLGRTSKVFEPDSSNNLTLETDYTYDQNGVPSTGTYQMIVTQKGGAAASSQWQTRTFTYDQTGRVIQETTPEAGTITFQYGNYSTTTGSYSTLCSGDLTLPCSRIDANGTTTTYVYDVLNRLNFMSYSDGTQQARFGYDGTNEAGTPLSAFGIQSLNAIGRLSIVTNGTNAATAYSYDALGRVALQTQGLPSTGWYQVPAVYDLAGNMTDLTYPDGRHIKQAFNGAGQLNTSNLLDINGAFASASYLQGINYYPDGSPSQITLGNGIVQSINKNNRMQVQSMTASTPLSPLSGQVFLSHTYCYVNCTPDNTANNGNIWGITDTLNSANTKGYTFDSLNRIRSFSLGGTVNQTYTADPFGNMTRMAGAIRVNTFDPLTNRINNLPCAASLTPFDFAGNQLCDSDIYGGIRQYGFDAENRIAQISMLGNSTPFVSYLYGADGSRVRKTNADGSYTEYVYFGGQPIAEHNSDGSWNDYIYANGQKIAKIAGVDNRIHTHGVFTASGNELRWNLPTPPVNPDGTPYTVKAGDMLCFRQYNAGAVGGPMAWFSVGGSTVSSAWAWSDTSGTIVNRWTTQGAWGDRCADLTMGGTTTGGTLALVSLLTDTSTPAGTWDIWYADMSITSTDGTVTQIIGSQPPTPVYGDFNGGAWSGTPSATVESPLATGPAATLETTSYFVTDHLGTARMEFAKGGWPMWKGEFTPFGQEINPQSTANNYKFTGQERDSESGLDHFTFRTYSSGASRWSSPDPYSGSYDLTNPQSLNRYSYVLNNPLIAIDPSGLMVTLCTDVNVCYSYTDDEWDALTGNGLGSGFSIDSNGNVRSASGSIVGSLTWTNEHNMVAPNSAGRPNDFGGTAAAPNSGQQKSSARQQCEATAQAHLTQNLHGAVNNGVFGSLTGGAGTILFNAAKGCLVGGGVTAIVGLELGPLDAVAAGAGCLEGAADGVVGGAGGLVVNAALSGGMSAGLSTAGAYANYNVELKSCKQF